jgi:hypothetical protein
LFLHDDAIGTGEKFMRCFVGKRLIQAS